MHLSEGVLSLPVAVAGWGVAVCGVAMGLRRMPMEQVARVALISAVLFLAALVRVPVGPTSLHLTLLGLAGILLGWQAVPALFVALLLQAVLFQFGGLVSLGTNTVIMGTAALTGSVVFHGLCRWRQLRQWSLPVAAFAGGFAAIVAGTLLLCLALTASHAAFATTARLLAWAQLPLAMIEGMMTMFIVGWLSRSMPDLLRYRHAGG